MESMATTPAAASFQDLPGKILRKVTKFLVPKDAVALSRVDKERQTILSLATINVLDKQQLIFAASTQHEQVDENAAADANDRANILQRRRLRRAALGRLGVDDQVNNNNQHNNNNNAVAAAAAVPPVTTVKHQYTRLQRIAIPLSHRIHSIFVKMIYPQTPLTYHKISILEHKVDSAPPFMEHSSGKSIGYFRILEPRQTAATCTFVPKKGHVYYLWNYHTISMTVGGHPAQLMMQPNTTTSYLVDIQVRQLIFDHKPETTLAPLTGKKRKYCHLAPMYNLLHPQLGSLQAGGLFYSRLLQSFADSTYARLKYNEPLDDQALGIFASLGIDVNLENMHTLMNLTMWVTEDLYQEEEDASVSSAPGSDMDVLLANAAI